MGLRKARIETLIRLRKNQLMAMKHCHKDKKEMEPSICHRDKEQASKMMECSRIDLNKTYGIRMKGIQSLKT